MVPQCDVSLWSSALLSPEKQLPIMLPVLFCFVLFCKLKSQIGKIDVTAVFIKGS